MVSTTTKVLGLLLYMNIVVYIGMGLAASVDGEFVEQDESFRLNGDILDVMLNVSVNNMIESYKENFTEYNVNLTTEFTKYPNLEGGEEVGVGGISFLDIVRMVSPALKTVFNVLVSPVTLFTTTRLPFFFVVLVGIPYLVIGVFSIVLLIRGVGD